MIRAGSVPEQASIERERNKVAAVVRAKLHAHMLDIGLDGVRSDSQVAPDLLGGVARAHGEQHFALARRELNPGF